jgi:hypothetical protein
VKPADFHPDAAREARAAAAFHEGQQAGLGHEFRSEMAAALLRVRGNPLRYAAEWGSIRVAPLH